MNLGPIDWPVFGKQVGLGFVLGFAIGYVAKKAIKVALAAVGILVLVLVVLQNYGFVSIHWHEIESVYNEALNPPGGLEAAVRSWIDSLAAVLPGAGGFTVGFLLGIRKG